MNFKITPLMMTLVAIAILIIGIVLRVTDNINNQVVLILIGCAVFIFLLGKYMQSTLLKRTNKELRKEIEALKKEIESLKQ